MYSRIDVLLSNVGIGNMPFINTSFPFKFISAFRPTIVDDPMIIRADLHGGSSATSILISHFKLPKSTNALVSYLSQRGPVADFALIGSSSFCNCKFNSFALLKLTMLENDPVSTTKTTKLLFIIPIMLCLDPLTSSGSHISGFSFILSSSANGVHALQPRMLFTVEVGCNESLSSEFSLSSFTAAISFTLASDSHVGSKQTLQTICCLVGVSLFFSVCFHVFHSSYLSFCIFTAGCLSIRVLHSNFVCFGVHFTSGSFISKVTFFSPLFITPPIIWFPDCSSF